MYKYRRDRLADRQLLYHLQDDRISSRFVSTQRHHVVLVRHLLRRRFILQHCLQSSSYGQRCIDQRRWPVVSCEFDDNLLHNPSCSTERSMSEVTLSAEYCTTICVQSILIDSVPENDCTFTIIFGIDKLRRRRANAICDSGGKWEFVCRFFDTSGL